jgi:hypothetical protein
MEVVVTIIASLIWAFVDFQAAKYLMKNHPGFEVMPELYALGAMLLGGLWPLLWLAGKFLLWHNKNK